MPRPRRVALVCLLGVACADRGPGPAPTGPRAGPPATTTAAAAAARSPTAPASPASTPPPPAARPDAASTPCARAGRVELAPGLVLERVPATVPPRAGAGDGCLTLLRADPARHRLRLLAAQADGGARPADRWVRDFGLTAAINASMYAPDRRSIGLLVDARAAHTARDNPRLGAFLAFDPARVGLPPVVLAGRPCAGFDLEALRRDYRSIVQNYRMFDCDGRPLAWKDEKIYSSAAVALDRGGHVVFVHVRTPYRMTEINAMLAAPALGLVAAMYVEGGPEASLYAHGGDTTVAEVGSFETAFHDGSNATFWPIPNVIALEPRR